MTLKLKNGELIVSDGKENFEMPYKGSVEKTIKSYSKLFNPDTYDKSDGKPTTLVVGMNVLFKLKTAYTVVNFRAICIMYKKENLLWLSVIHQVM